MTKFNHSAHIRLWDWLSKNPGHEKFKRNWPEWEERGGSVKHVTSHCFACEYALKHTDYGDTVYGGEAISCCDNCPLLWPNGISCINHGLHEKYCNATKIEKSALAEQIRDLPVKDGIECE